MDKIVIFGAGGHSKVVAEAIELEKKFEIYGFASMQANQEKLYNYPLFPQSEVLSQSFPISRGIIAIGDNFTRAKLVEFILKLRPDFQFISAIHPSSIVSSTVKIGKGSVLLAGSVINAGSLIGDHCIINTCASIDHDCSVDNFTSIGPGCVLGGNVKIGKMSAISLGARIIHNIEIGDHTIIGAGSTTLTSIASYKVAYGTPSKEIRSRVENESYL